MAKNSKKDEPLRSTRPTRASAPPRGQVSHSSPSPAGTADAGTLGKGQQADLELRGDETHIPAQTGGSRGASNEIGEDHVGTRNARSSVAGADEPTQTASKAGGSDEPIRGPLPPDTIPEDYLGGEKPHKTREEGGTRNHASRKRNEVL